MALKSASVEVLTVKLEGEKQVLDAYKRIFGHQGKLEESTVSADKALAKSEKGLGSFQAKLVTLGSAIQVAQAGMVAFSRAVSALKAPVQLAIDFEASFARVTTLLDTTGAGLDNLREGLLRLASESRFTAGEITEAAYQAISASIPEDQVEGFLRAASRSAVAAGASLTSTVELLTGTVNAFGSQGVDAAQASDIFFSTVKRGVITIEELRGVMSRAAPLAAFGVSLEEVGAALASLTKKGVESSEAMTQIVAMTKLLASDSLPGAKAMRELGIETGVAALQQKGLTGVLEDVRQATNGSAVAINSFGNRMEAKAGLINLLSDQLGDYNSILDANRDSTGETDLAYGKLIKTTEGAIAQFNALSEDVLRRLGDQILPNVNRMLQRFGQFLRQNGDEVGRVIADLANKFIRFGDFILDHGAEIMATIKGIFTVIAVSQFAGSLVKARAELVKFSAASAAAGAGFAGSIAGALKSPTVVSAALVAAGALGGLIGNAIGQAMTEEYREHAAQITAETAERDIQTQKMIEARGAKDQAGLDQFYSGVRSGAFVPRPGQMRGAALAEGVTIQDVPTAEAALSEAGSVQAFRETMEAQARARQAEAEEATARMERLTDQIEEARQTERSASRRGVMVDQREGMREDIANLESDYRRAMEEETEARRAAAETIRTMEATIAAATVERGRSGPVIPPKTKKGGASEVMTFGALDVGAVVADEDAKILEDEEARNREREAKEIELQARLFEAQGRGLEARMVRMRASHAAEFEAEASAGGDIIRLKQAQLLEERALRDEMDDRATQGAFDAGIVELESEVRMKEARGEFYDAKMLDLEIQHAREQQAAEGNAEMLLAIDEEYNRRKKEIQAESFESIVGDISSTGNAVGGAIQSMIASHGSLSQARMKQAKADLKAGKITEQAYRRQAQIQFEAEKKQIIAGGVMSGFQGAVEAAMALSSYAAGNVPKGIAHTAASVAHFANAASANEKANAAYSANMAGLDASLKGKGGGGGGGGPASGGFSTSGGTSPGDLETQDTRPRIQFGDIVLSDVPGLLSDDGVRALGGRIAQSVTEEINRQGEIPGGFRMNGDA
ncbi:MAG: phage tail tape measure protein [Bdellovibrionaceae bacterium]|nr:phage tail tape measure protein [Pseudobdellovibrionaceae bacterium]|tara:strand:+ start:9357 stop:12608 length:3252 start_codon:yes stop_codon:yes gene_type:complete